MKLSTPAHPYRRERMQELAAQQQMINMAMGQQGRGLQGESESKPAAGEEERKAGRGIVRSSPPGFMLPEPEEIRRAQRDALEGKEAGYTKDYEFMIRKYFESLGRGSN